MKYVVTGGAGFIGSNLVDSLIDKNNEVHIIDNFLSGKIQNCHPNAIIHELDIADEKNLYAIRNIFYNTLATHLYAGAIEASNFIREKLKKGEATVAEAVAYLRVAKDIYLKDFNEIKNSLFSCD